MVKEDTSWNSKMRENSKRLKIEQQRAITGSEEPFLTSNTQPLLTNAHDKSEGELKGNETFNDKNQYPCDFCEKSYDNPGKRYLHEKIHVGEIFVCPCRRPQGESFVQECEFCDEIFDIDGNYYQYVKKVHIRKPWITIEKDVGQSYPLICELCGKDKKKKELKKHMKDMHKMEKDLEREKPCVICFKESEKILMFYSYEGLRIHKKQKHETKDRRLDCSLCDSRFLNSING